MLKIHEKYRPFLLAFALLSLVGVTLFTIDLFDLGGPAQERCCATGWDPAPLERTPAGTVAR